MSGEVETQAETGEAGPRGEDVAALTFEAALRELEGVVAALETGEVALEESIALYARGAALRAHCQKKLEEAEARVSQITEGPGGAVQARPVDLG